MEEPLLSIAVPAYNVEAYLEHGLSTYCDVRLEGLLEVIIVNDGSTDETRAIAQRYVERAPHIFKLVDKQNGGHGSAINAGIKASSAKYFRVIDGDDWADTENLVRVCQALKNINTDLVVDVKCEVNMLSGASEMFSFPSYIPKGSVQNFADICTRDEIASYIMIHTLMIKRDYLKSIDFSLLEHTFYVDYEYIVKATLCAHDIYFLDENVCQYLIGNINQSVSDINYVKRFSDHERVVHELLRLYEQKKDSLEKNREAYLVHRCELICNTHYNIALIFDKDRAQGMRRAKKFHSYLRTNYPEIAKLTNRRYVLAKVLHYAGIKSQEELNKFRHKM